MIAFGPFGIILRLLTQKEAPSKIGLEELLDIKAIDYVRKHLKELENKNIEDLVIPVADDSLQRILAKEFEEEMEKILSSLPEDTREIFKQLFFEEKDLDELAESTGFSKPVLYNRISRGRKKLRKVLGGGL